MKTSVEKSETTYVLRLNEKELAYLMACTGVFIDRGSDCTGLYDQLSDLAGEERGWGDLAEKHFKVEAQDNPVIKNAGVDRARQS